MALKDMFSRKSADLTGTFAATRQSNVFNDITEEKEPFDWSNLGATLQGLDLNNVAEWPLFAKVGAAIFAALLVNALVFALFTNGIRGLISEAQVEEERLLQEYKGLDSKVRTLSQYEQQYQKMELEFNQLLDKLPREINAPDLVEEINVAGMRSGIRFKSILVKPEVVKDSTSELPVDMEAVGDYHGFGAFASEISNLSRIITLHDFTIKSQEGDAKNANKGVPVLTLTVLANTYRYNGNVAAKANDAAAQGAQ